MRSYRDLQSREAPLQSLGVSHGSLVFLRYTVERLVTPTQGLDTRPFGALASRPRRC